ncbi:sugar transporter ERD6-like 18 [Lathyrus oleraceus]|uniref:sugar transporter ERD6-like 18 n=1 Tax=Pisum sativum TaxID=3888 RepID=UPI0021D0DE36|nr:sugar transporter ERD6-like 18 [Pisum sativum]
MAEKRDMFGIGYHPTTCKVSPKKKQFNPVKFNNTDYQSEHTVEVIGESSGNKPGAPSFVHRCPPGFKLPNWAATMIPMVYSEKTANKTIDYDTAKINYESGLPINQAEDGIEEDCELPAELARLLEHEEKEIQPYKEPVDVINLGSETDRKEVKVGASLSEHVLATILTLWLADKSGRRLLLIVSSSAMALSLLVVSISFYLKEYISPDSDLYATLSLVSVAGVVIMVIAFSLGLGAMPWIIMSEILPINIKGLAGSFATLANWFFSWLVTLTTNLLLDWSSGGTFTIYTAVCVFTVGFVAIWVPETKGKTLEEIQ